MLISHSTYTVFAFTGVSLLVFNKKSREWMNLSGKNQLGSMGLVPSVYFMPCTVGIS